MDKRNQWIALALAGCVAVLAGGWFLLVSPQRSEAAELRLAAQAQEATNVSLRTKLQVLAAQARDLPQQQATIAKVATQLPPRTDLPALVRSLEQAAKSADVELVDIAPGTPAPVTAAGGPAAGAATAGLQSVSLELRAFGGYFALQQFLTGLEGLTRATRVTGLTLGPGTSPLAALSPGGLDDGRTLTAAIRAQVYVSAPAAAPAAAAAPATGAPAAAAGGTSAAPATGTGAAPGSGTTGAAPAGAATTPSSGTAPAAPLTGDQ